MNHKMYSFIFVISLLFSNCLCEVTEELQPNHGHSDGDGYQPYSREITADEQSTAIPRHQPVARCLGCSSYVNPQAAGVTDLANLGVRHLDLHEPNVRHSLQSVIDIQRQVVNGVRYILTLSINFNNCTDEDTDTDVCISDKPCKITILEKPWQKLPSGAKYRAILVNNCTEEWLFGDAGEVLPELTDRSGQTDEQTRDEETPKAETSSNDDVITPEQQEDNQSEPNIEHMITEDFKDCNSIDSNINACHYTTVEQPVENLDIEDPKFKVLAEESLQKYIQDTNNNELLKVFAVESVTKQDGKTRISFVVTDGRTILCKCNSKVREHDSDRKDIDVSCQDCNVREEKHIFTGGHSYVDASDPKYTLLAEESLLKYVSDSGTSQPHKVVEVKNVSTQVVAGVFTKIDFSATPTDSSSGNAINCHSEIWEKAWLKFKDITVSCKNAESEDKENAEE